MGYVTFRMAQLLSNKPGKNNEKIPDDFTES